ncbi:MAG: tetratricopeptide repeat protein [Chloroflexi bacterium]|nr:tetratricopeptide repeat protein [Chloroflexota bacterium]
MQKFLNQLFGSNQPREQPSPALSPEQQAINEMLETAATALEQGYYDTALETYERGLARAREQGDTRSEEHFLSGIGATYVARRDFDTARPLLDEALEIARTLGDRRALTRTLNNLGSFFAQQNEWGTAQTYHQQALDEAREIGEASVLALTLENLAKDYLNQDNPSYAQHLLKEAITVAQRGGQAPILARLLGLLAEATLAVGDRVTGHRLLNQAVQIAQQTGQNEQHLRWLRALAELEIENRNYALAIEYYQSAENLALRLGNQPAEFFMNSALDLSLAYQLSGNSTQAEEYATRALAQARSADNSELEANALTRLGMAANTMGEWERAEGFLTEALAFYENGALHDREEHVQILLALGNIQTRLHNVERARAFTEQALSIAQSADDPRREASALHLLGNLALEQGNSSEALERWQAALDLLAGADPVQEARLRCDIAGTRRERGDFNGALSEYERALLLLNNFNHPPTRGLVLSNAATLYTDLGDVDTAKAFYDESIEIARNSGDARAESLRLGNLGWFYSLTGQPRTAINKLEEALKLSRALDDTLMIAVQTNNLARTYYQLADYDTARTLHKQAIAAANALDDDRWLAVFQSDMGATLEALERDDEAEPLYESALGKSRAQDDLENIVRTLTRLASLYRRTGRAGDAHGLITEAHQIARRMDYKKGLADVAAVQGDLARDAGDVDTAQHYYAEARRLYAILHDPLASRVGERVDTIADPAPEEP